MDSAMELSCALEACALIDRSNWGRLLATGKDILDLLHRLSTADLKHLKKGDGRPTVITSPKGRIIARLHVHHLGEPGVLLVADPGLVDRVRAHIDRFTFSEQTGIGDVSGAWAHFSVVGPRAREAARQAVCPIPDENSNVEIDLGGGAGYVLGTDGHSTEGLSYLVPAGHSEAARAILAAAVEAEGGASIGAEAAEAWRVLRGFPIGDHELTEQHNPLEAGLRDAVSFRKGCYVGQEVVARLNTYDKVSRELVVMTLPEGSAVPERGTPLFKGERPVGEITSAVLPPGRHGPVVLAYLKRDHVGAQDITIGKP